MRLIRISLAAKYRYLYGVAVLLIIAATLYLPWHRFERLADQQPFREAQRAVDDFYRDVFIGPDHPIVVNAPRSGAMAGLVSRAFAQPVFVRASLNPEDSASLPQHAELGSFAGRALAKFLRDRKAEYVYEIRPSAEGRRFLYAHAVRATSYCTSCHGEGKSAGRFAEDELIGFVSMNQPIDEDRNVVLVNRGIIIASGALAGVLAVLVFYVITHRFLLGPIEELREVARRVTEGDIAVRSSLRTGDEFEQLAVSFNEMLERLRASQEELRTANRSLDARLGELAETNIALYESNRIKSEFIANVSHELRTPLTSIIGFAELLRDSPGVDSNGKAARYSENILISGRILLEIINDLLDLAKIEAGKVELRIEEFRIDELCATLADFVRPLTDKKRITLECDCVENLPALHSDRGRVRQILYNLLSNAVKFTPEGGSVRIVASGSGADRVRVSVTDTGPGIDEKHQSIIFEKFRQIDASATREHYGTGLGLPIAKELAELLGGSVGVVSNPGEGATFWVELPLVCAATAERPMVSLV